MSNALKAIRDRNEVQFNRHGNELETPAGSFVKDGAEITFYGAKGGFESVTGADKAAVAPFFM